MTVRGTSRALAPLARLGKRGVALGAALTQLGFGQREAGFQPSLRLH
jgi:hypothetical protein